VDNFNQDCEGNFVQTLGKRFIVGIVVWLIVGGCHDLIVPRLYQQPRHNKFL
jgi:hypothetical protein